MPNITRLALPGNVIAVWVLIGLNVLMYFVTIAASFVLVNSPLCVTPQGSFGSSYDCALFLLGWKDNFRIYLMGEYWRLLTATFLHGGIFHLLVNGFSLYVLGPDNERIFGTWRFLAVYLIGGLSGSILSYSFSISPSVGASGAIFGLAGSLLVFFYRVQNVLGEFGMSQMQGLLVLVGINLFIGFTMPGIDNLGHIGGLIGGAVAAWFLMPRFSLQVRPLQMDRVVVRELNPQDWIAVPIILAVLIAAALVVQPPILP